jgi:phi LC3 family holin
MFISLIVGFVFNILKMFDIAPSVTQNTIMDAVSQFLTFLGMIGVLVDPTTAGINDSVRAMEYDKPWDDEANKPINSVIDNG